MYILLCKYYSNPPYRKGPFLWVYPPLPYDHSSWPVYYVPWTFHLGIKRLIKFHYKWVGRGEGVHTPADAIGRDIYMHIHLLLEKRSSQFLRPYVATWTAIHPSVYTFCIWYRRVSCISQLLLLIVLTVIAIRKLCWSLSHDLLFLLFLPLSTCI